MGKRKHEDDTVIKERKKTRLQQTDSLLLNEGWSNERIVKQLEFTFPKKVVNDIRSAVEEIVQRILTSIEIQDSRLKVNKLLKVGGSYDGTKICYPDEFDFIVVLDKKKFGNGKTLKIRKTQGRVEFVESDMYITRIDFNFFRRIVQAVRRLCKRNMDTVKKGSGTLHFENHIDDERQCTCKLNGPATTVRLVWNKSLYISVDIVPAVRMGNVEKHLSRSDVKYEKFYDTILEKGSFLLIRRHGELQMSFTESEKVLIKDQFPQKHRDLLKILKYRNKHPVFPSWLTSYMLKKCVIRHHYSCRHSVTKSISHCLKDVMQCLTGPGENAENDWRIPDLFVKPLSLDGHGISLVKEHVKTSLDRQLRIHLASQKKRRTPIRMKSAMRSVWKSRKRRRGTRESNLILTLTAQINH